MAVLLPAPRALVPVCLSRYSRSSKKRKHQRPQDKKVPLVSKSPMTPLLNNQMPETQTKHQLLDQVLTDIQVSISRGVKVDHQIFSSLLETCFRLQSVQHGVQLHRLIPPNLLRKSADLSSKLLRLYADFGLVDEAQQLFDEMPRCDGSAFAWNSLISGYTEVGLYEDAMAIYFQMEEEGVEPDQHTFPRVLKACGGLGSIQIGEAVHRHIVRSGFGTDPFVLNALVAMYAKCGDIVKARKTFDNLLQRDSVSWNTMLTGYIRHGLFVEALDVFRKMVNDGVKPDFVAVSSILACTESLILGLEIHGWVLRNSNETSLSVMNSLITLYGRHGQVGRARILFDEMPVRDVVSWNVMIKCFSYDNQALVVFQQMEDSGVFPDHVTFVSLLSTCASLGLVEEGKTLFAKMEDRYRIKARVEHYACMVNLLGRAGRVDEAYQIIEKNMGFEGGGTAWGALLYACSLHGNVEIGEATAEMLFELEPDNRENFELLRKIYRDAGRLVEEERVRRLMLARGLE